MNKSSISAPTIPSTASDNARDVRHGILLGALCYSLWGLFPLYWLPILDQPITADQLLAQRIIWSSLLTVILVIATRELPALFKAICTPRTLLLFFLSAVLLCANWLIYLWGITNDFVLDASLGYFLCPLVSIALGILFAGEKINRGKAVAITLALSGVLWLAAQGTHIPWVAIGISLTWGFYGLVRKKAPLGALVGLTLETLMLLPFAAIYLYYLSTQNQLVFSELPALPIALIIGSGAITTFPLLAFASAVKKVELSTLAVLQYISPTLQFIFGLWVFKEAFDQQRFIGYVLVWCAVIVFALNSFLLNRKKTRQ